MKYAIILALVCLPATRATAQNTAYSAYVHQADSLTSLKQFAQAATAYRNAFGQLGGKANPTHRYNAACVMSLAGQKDSAFYHLFRLAEAPAVAYSNYSHITTD